VCDQLSPDLGLWTFGQFNIRVECVVPGLMRRLDDQAGILIMPAPTKQGAKLGARLRAWRRYAGLGTRLPGDCVSRQYDAQLCGLARQLAVDGVYCVSVWNFARGMKV